MLSALKHSSSLLSRRTTLILGCLAIGALAVPTLKWTADGPLAGLAKPAAPQSLALLVDQKPGAGPANGTPAAAPDNEPAEEFFPRPTDTEKRILDALQRAVDVEFANLPLADCINELQQQAKIDLWVDHQKIMDEGIAMDQLITLKLKGRRLESVLNLFLRPAALTYFIDDDVLKITTETVAGETMFTRAYPVSDLCPDVKDKEKDENGAVKNVNLPDAEPRIKFALFQGFGGGGGGSRGPIANESPAAGGQPPANGPAGAGGGVGGGGFGGGGGMQWRRGSNWTTLMNAISTTVDPDTWEELSGPGSMVPVRETGSLVIRQTWSVHRKVLQLLRDLRAAKRLQRTAK